MDATLCNVIYVDRTVRQDRVIRARPDANLLQDQLGSLDINPPCEWESPTLEQNVNLLADVFGDVHLCATSNACISRLFNLQDESMLDLKPSIVLIDTPYDERIPLDDNSQAPSRSPSPHSAPQESAEAAPPSPSADDAYGLRLLQRIVSEAHLRNLSKLVIPVPVIGLPASHDGTANSPESSEPARVETDTNNEPTQAHTSQAVRPSRRPLLKRCLKLGATDVLISPVQAESITSLEIHAYWAHKSAARDQQALLEFRRGRKRSWVGVSDARPYAYLRENMVAGLMRNICQMGNETELPVDAIRINVASHRKPAIAQAVGSWHFSAHDLNDDELIEAAALMFRHALTMSELQEWAIPTDQLICFLIACRAAYNSFVPYHNFRHVVDVLQATFNFLVNVGALPPYPDSSPLDKPVTPTRPKTAKSPMASLLHPFEALTLLITAIGHDVGHPGVNNGFLTVLNAPLAQLYNDRSVLESFHCAAYSQILRRYWPAAFANTKMRNLMISSILATDMGLHFDYMKKLGSTQDKLAENNTTDGWNGRMTEEQAALACALLIKCADISNVARRHDTAVRWMYILSDEFSRQAFMEDQLSIKSSLASPPKKDTVSLFRSQLGFMNLFAIPLFQGVANIMPAMQYCVDELEVNKALFEKGVAEGVAKAEPTLPRSADGTFSPRTMSLAIPLATADEKDMPCGPQAIAASATHTTSNSTESGDGCPPSAASNIASSLTFAGPLVLDHAAYKESGGPNSQFDAVAEFAASDPFNVNDGRSFAPTKQRVSEATDGSTSVPSGGDWASQATSATTGKMPLSPSTQGTSIISRDSLSRPSSGPVISISTTRQEDSIKMPSDSLTTTQLTAEDVSSLSSGGNTNSNATTKPPTPDGKTLKKKTSRFRMNAITFFRRHLSPGPPLPTSNPNPDTTPRRCEERG